MNTPVDIDNARAENVCKMGQGALCCSFLGMSRGFVCVKGSNVEATIRERREQKSMVAMGDNCSGPPDFKSIHEPRRYDPSIGDNLGVPHTPYCKSLGLIHNGECPKPPNNLEGKSVQ